MAYRLTRSKALRMVKRAYYYLTHWEVWHWFAKYIIIGPSWLWLCIKARSFWFFTPANPSITFGGFIGEAKSEIYPLLPPGSYPKSIYVTPQSKFEHVHRSVENAELNFPIAVKPDVGMMGFMFRKLEDISQLRQYHNAMPVRYIVQELIEYPLEVSVFYYRYPGHTRGNITGFIKKEFMQVIGDGEKTLRQLILEYPRAQFRLKEMFSKHEHNLNSTIAKDKAYCLSFALNLSRGGKLISLEHEKDSSLLKIFDELSLYSGSLFYGRYDIKCASIEDLKQGKNFSILEYNGCGAEPHHVYGNGNSFLKACNILVQHWKILFEIAEANKRLGIAPWTHQQGVDFTANARKHFKVLKELDASFELEAPITNEVQWRTSETSNYAEPVMRAQNSLSR